MTVTLSFISNYYEIEVQSIEDGLRDCNVPGNQGDLGPIGSATQTGSSCVHTDSLCD